MKTTVKRSLNLNKKTVILLQQHNTREKIMGGAINADFVVDSKRICDTTNTQVCSVIKACLL